MAVIVSGRAERFTASEVLWAKDQLVQALVREALVGQTEAFIELIQDNEPSDIGREGINEILRGVPASAEDFLRDVISDLEREVARQIAQARYGAAVTGIKYDLAGDIKDIEVDLTVTFEGE